MRPPVRSLVLPLLAAALAGQSSQPPVAPPAGKAATFHLPAGEYSVAELLQQAGQALRRPIAVAAELPADAAPLRLQCDLALPQQAWEDVLDGYRVTGLSSDATGVLERHEAKKAGK